MRISGKVYDYLIIPRQSETTKKIEIPIGEFYQHTSGSLVNRNNVDVRIKNFLEKKFPDEHQNILEVDIENKGAGNYYLIVNIKQS